MNKEVHIEDDNLRRYINPGSIEKAPEGFTAKTMTRIEIESESITKQRTKLFKSPVLLVSILGTAALIAAAIFIPAGTSDTIGLAVVKYLSNLGISLSGIKLSPLPDLNLPGWFAYGIIGVLFLALFDRTLFGMFHRQGK